MTRLTRANVGYLLAKAMERWNEVLLKGFRERGYPEIKASYGSVLIPLFEEDGLAMSELAERSRLSKQTMTTLVPEMEAEDLVRRRPDPEDGRVRRVFLTDRSRGFAPVAEDVLRRLDEALERALGSASVEELRALLQRVPSLEASFDPKRPGPAGG